MATEHYKAENTEEIVWLRLNRLKNCKLCKKLIQAKLEKSPNKEFNESILEAKAIGLSSAISSAIGYWETKTHALNAKILSRYYFLLQMTIGEQVSSTKNIKDLKGVQKHTEQGHGLATIMNPQGNFPNDFYVYPIQSGHFYSYANELGVNMKSVSFNKRSYNFDEVENDNKLVSLTDIFRRIPELNGVIEEYLDVAPLAFHIGHSTKNMYDWSRKVDANLEKTGQITSTPPEESDFKITFIDFYTDSKKVTPEFLASLPIPFFDYEVYNNNSYLQSNIIGKHRHQSGIQWFESFKTYSSSYATSTYAVPLWSKEYDSIVTNFAALYSLSIIVRYMPDLWQRITLGDLQHIGSLIEYYISVIDHVIPIHMLERITGNSISIQTPGSLFGQV